MVDLSTNQDVPVTRLFAILCTLLLLAGSLHASEPPVGKFKVFNTAGFVQEQGNRRALAADPNGGTAEILRKPDNSLIVTIAGTEIQLFPLADGLGSLDWNALGTSLLHGVDIEALNNKTDQRDVPAWGADLAWPGMGKVQLALLPLGATAYTGFLISHPEDKVVVRQMEFRQVFGPSNRPSR